MHFLWLVLPLQAISIAAECLTDSCRLALRSATHISGRHAAAQGFCTAYIQDPTIDVPNEARVACQDESNVLDQTRIASACACELAPTGTISTLVTPAQITSPPAASEDSFVEPCALVSSSSAAQVATAPSAWPTVSAQLAHECLNSVPLNKTAAIELVNAIGPYLEWQSDLAWKKDPPADYDCPAHDVIAALGQLRENLVENKYANEYLFQVDLYQVFLKACDGHMIYFPDAVARAFLFGRQRSLVSVSEDGRSLPVIKLYEDVSLSPDTASIVTHINGIIASTYISDYSSNAAEYQDADAVYNSMFFSKASYTASGSKGYFLGGGRLKYVYPGPMTMLTFANGSSLEIENNAMVMGDFTNVANGQLFYSTFCSVDVEHRQPVYNKIESPGEHLIFDGYPIPVIRTKDSTLSGYYLDGQGFEEVAILSVFTFGPTSTLEFQQAAEQFLIGAKRDGKKKIIIDLSSNEGGYTFMGYDIFRQFFPTMEPKENFRWRAGEAFMAIAKILSSKYHEFLSDNTSNHIIPWEISTFSHRYDTDIDNKPFRSFEEKFGPYQIKGDKFTNNIRWCLSEPCLTSSNSYSAGIEITGYGSRRNFAQQFHAKDIIMLHDGSCSSACYTFSEYMRVQGVKSIVMGGRPKEGLTQGVGGNKGALILSWKIIWQYAQDALTNASGAQAEILKKLTALPLQRSLGGNFNVRDSISLDHLGDGLPAQFVREESDCRLFYTEEMITDIGALWRAAADAAFNGKECAYGSLPKRTSGVSVD